MNLYHFGLVQYMSNLSDLERLIDHLDKRPKMFVLTEDIESLYLILLGWDFASSQDFGQCLIRRIAHIKKLGSAIPTSKHISFKDSLKELSNIVIQKRIIEKLKDKGLYAKISRTDSFLIICSKTAHKNDIMFSGASGIAVVEDKCMVTYGQTHVEDLSFYDAIELVEKQQTNVQK